MKATIRMAMTPEQWDCVRDLFHQALDVSPAERPAFLNAACTDDHLRAEVETLLSSGHEPSLGSLDRPALAGGPHALAAALGTHGNSRLQTGQTVGAYEIVAPLGVGGMGEVYRARDLRLKREVALKVLPQSFAADPERMARFQREAQVLASLNHPNIAQIYGVVEDRALVMELVNGETLSAPSPVPIALSYARQLAEALEYAHEKGVVHRDLKPANIKVTAEGTIKVLDFGLAKVTGQRPASGDPSVTPTATLTATQSGMILGTAAYMSPEQAAGRPVDRRADVWSFGVIFWEMLTGRKLFQGESAAHILAAVLTARIEFALLPRETPARIRDLLARCLDRDEKTRLRDLGEARVIIQKCLSDGSRAPAEPGIRRRRLLRAGVAAALIGMAAASVSLYSNRSLPLPGPERWRQITNFPDSAAEPALSRDGRMLAFTRGGGFFLGRNKQVYVKLLPDGIPVKLTHDPMAKMFPQFSPDGSRIAYSVGGFHTWTVPVFAGGEPHLMLPNAEGLTWIDSRRILFSEIKPNGMGIEVASESRASEREVYMPVDGMAHFSSLSPDGKQALVVEMIGTGPFIPCRLVPFDGKSRGRQVGPVPSVCEAAAWSPDGKWMYFNANTGRGAHIWRQRVDSEKPEQLTFGPSEEEGLAVAPDGQSLFTSVGMSHDGIWLHSAGGDRQISGEGANYGDPIFSADGTRVYYPVGTARVPSVTRELRAVDLQTGQEERILTGVPIAMGISISNDGKSVIYRTSDETSWIAPLDHRSPPRELPIPKATSVQMGRSGRLYFTALRGDAIYLFTANLNGSERRQIFPDPIQDDRIVKVSPDEQWLVTEVTEDDAGHEPYMQAYPTAGGPARKICKQCWVRWSADGTSALLRFRALYGGAGGTVAVALAPGEMLPPLPSGGFQTADEAKALPGAFVIPYENMDVQPGTQNYAYVRGIRQSNIFQIPLR